jgi:hypothetical protein
MTWPFFVFGSAGLPVHIVYLTGLRLGQASGTRDRHRWSGSSTYG